MLIQYEKPPLPFLKKKRKNSQKLLNLKVQHAVYALEFHKCWRIKRKHFTSLTWELWFKCSGQNLNFYMEKTHEGVVQDLSHKHHDTIEKYALWNSWHAVATQHMTHHQGCQVSWENVPLCTSYKNQPLSSQFFSL